MRILFWVCVVLHLQRMEGSYFVSRETLLCSSSLGCSWPLRSMTMIPFLWYNAPWTPFLFRLLHHGIFASTKHHHFSLPITNNNLNIPTLTSHTKQDFHRNVRPCVPAKNTTATEDSKKRAASPKDFVICSRRHRRTTKSITCESIKIPTIPNKRSDVRRPNGRLGNLSRRMSISTSWLQM